MDKSIFTAEYKSFLKHLREARENSGLTQADLGERLGQTQSFVSKCERGERRLDVIELMAFCDALEIDFTRFVTSLQREPRRSSG
jgi:transcriptional regulator with XRE-family HTH domain